MVVSRKRRTLRWVVLTLAVAVLLPVWYIVAWLTVSKALARRYIPRAYADSAAVAFRPLISYADSDSVGAESLQWAYYTVNWEYYSLYMTLSPYNRDDVSFSDRKGFLAPNVRSSVIRKVAKDRE